MADLLLDGIEAIEQTYGLPTGFMRGLLAEDDWSFVIKAHALVEAAVSGLLTSRLGTKELAPIFQRLELSNQDTGKLAFAKALDLLAPHDRTFIRKFSELRNDLVHQVQNTSFNIQQYLSSLDPNQRKAFRDSVLNAAATSERQQQWRDMFASDPKLALFAAVFRLVIVAKLNTDVADSQNRYVAAQLAEIERLFGGVDDPTTGPPAA